MNMEEYIEHLQSMAAQPLQQEVRTVKQLRITKPKKLSPKQFKTTKR